MPDDLIDHLKDHDVPCPGCSYDMRGSESAVCPECGRTLSEADLGNTVGDMVKRLGPAAVLGVAWTFLPAVCGFMLLANLGNASDWLNTHQEWGPAVYIGIFIVTAGFGFLPTYAQAVLGGFAFGWWGVPAALAGFAGAACVGRVVATTVSGDRVEHEIDRNAKAVAVRDALVGHGFWKTLGMVTLLRVPPNSPFALTNGVMSTTGVGWIPYVVGTAVGMLPRTAAAVYIGIQVQEILQDPAVNEFTGEQIREARPTWMFVAGIVLAIAVVIVVGKIANNAIKKVTGVGGNVEDDAVADSDEPSP